MPAMKRPASASAAKRGAKRVATGRGKGSAAASKALAAKAKGVVKVIGQASEDFPVEVLHMVGHALPRCLAAFKEDRHFTQAEVVSMAGRILAALEGRRAAAVDQAARAMDEAQATQTRRDAAVGETQAEATARSAAVMEAKFRMQEAAGREAAAKAALTDAEAAPSVAASALAVTNKARLALEGALHNDFAAIRAGGADEAHVKAFLSFIKKQGFEEQLLISAGPALRRPAPERGSFDVTVFERVEAELKLRIEPLAAKARSLEAELEKHRPEVDRCRAALDAAHEAATLLQKEHLEAVELERAAKAAIRTAETEAKACRPALKKVTAAHAAAGAALAEAREALHAFAQLEARAPAAEAAEAAEEPAAEAAAAEPEAAQVQ